MDFQPFNTNSSSADEISELLAKALAGNPDHECDETYGNAIYELSVRFEVILPVIRELIASGDTQKRRVALDTMVSHR